VLESSPHASRPLRILWITTGALVDGPGRVLSAVLSHWPSGDALAVAAVRDVAPAFRVAVPPTVQTEAFSMAHALDLGALRRLDRFVARWQPDIVHTQLSRGDWYGRTIARRRGIPVVSTIQNVHSRMYQAEFSRPLAFVGRALDRVSAPAVARFVAVSRGVAADLERAGVERARIAVIPNTFDPARTVDLSERSSIRQAWGVSPTDVVVGTVALAKPQKNLRLLVDAAAIAAARDVTLRFVHVGDGPLEGELRRWVAEAGLGERMRLAGRVVEPMAVLPAFDIFAMTSDWEGLPVALLEAMAAGVCAVGTRVSGIEDVIEDGVTGRLVPPRDAASLADAILALAGSPETRTRLATAAREGLERYDARRVATLYRAVYLDVLAALARTDTQA
jgi:glycosyltransferase involved in cell wall biosynthesis